MRRLLWLPTLVLVACVGDDPAAPNGAIPADGGAPAESLPEAGAPACTATCEGDTLRTCDGNSVVCPLGCRSAPGPAACQTFVPSAPLAPADLEPHGASTDLTVGRSADEEKVPLVFDTQNGSIQQPAIRAIAARTVRPANDSPDVGQELAGIWFERRGGVAIFRSDAWLLRNVRMIGDLPVALVAAKDIRVFGRLEITCGQLGGGAGGLASAAGAGAGGGAKGSPHSGGGGGGHDGKGGSGAGSKSGPGGVGGLPFAFVAGTFAGGGGGGGGASRGGGGGGAILLSAGGAIEIGDGLVTKWWPDGTAERNVLQGVDAGGCGGLGGASNGSGGGGGAGGLILVESPSVVVRSSAGLAANGGGGGGGGPSAGAGARGDIVALRSAGGTPGGLTCMQGKGGDGAGGLVPEGAAGLPGDYGRLPSVCRDVEGATIVSGAGGGGGGRIRIATRTGLLTDSSAAILTPSPGVTQAKLEVR